MAFTLGQLAASIGAELRGDSSALISSIATLQLALPDQLAYLASPRYRPYLAATQAGAVILAEADLHSCPVAALIVNNPTLGYARAAELLYPRPVARPGIHSSACVDPSSHIHASASIGPLCVIGPDCEIGACVQIGAGCIIGEGVAVGVHSQLLARITLCAGTIIGRRALIQPGAVIGSRGFGFANDQGRWVKIPQLGRVRIGDDVEIGANTTIDCGALEDTVISDGVKLDNLIQVAHNVQIGEHTAIAGCVGIAGSAKIGKRCTIGGGVGVAGHLEIVDDVHITGMTLVSKSILKPGVYSSGVPAQENRLWNKNYARLCRLDEMAQTLRTLKNNT